MKNNFLEKFSRNVKSKSAEMAMLKNCWACDISSGSRTLKRGGVAHRAPKAQDSRGVWGHAPP